MEKRNECGLMIGFLIGLGIGIVVGVFAFIGLGIILEVKALIKGK